MCISVISDEEERLGIEESGDASVVVVEDGSGCW